MKFRLGKLQSANVYDDSGKVFTTPYVLFIPDSEDPPDVVYLDVSTKEIVSSTLKETLQAMQEKLHETELENKSLKDEKSRLLERVAVLEARQDKQYEELFKEFLHGKSAR